MNDYEKRLAAWESELREKYTDADREKMAKSGEAMADGSYPIADEEDLENAIHAVGRGNASHDAIRKHIIARAKALGKSDAIPDNWNADGSLKQENSRRNPALGAAKRRKNRHHTIPRLAEVRHYAATGLEVRSATDSDEIVITGAAIVYDTPYIVRDFFGEFEERMMPGCVADVLSNGVDCRLLLNHAGLAMARTTAGTLRLIDTPRSLNIEAHLDARQQLANDFAIAVERGDMNQMSIGMIVGLDEWGDNGTMETRDVYKLTDLSDVSGVTYPCSPTTNLEVAHRMLMEMPVESRARVRRLLLDVKAQDLRAGKVLSGPNQDKVVEATKALHAVLATSGLDPADLLDNSEDAVSETSEDGSVGDDSATGQGAGAADGSGDQSGSIRQEDPGDDASKMLQRTARRARRAAAEASYNDLQCAAADALVAKYGDDDGDMDLWVCDMSDDWIVFESYIEPPGMGTWQIGYSLDGDAVVLDGDPVRVVRQTSYVPAGDDMPAGTVTPTKTSRALWLRAEAHKLRVL